MEKSLQPANPKRKSTAILIDFFFATIVWGLFFFFFPSEKISQITIQFLLRESFFLSYGIFLFFLFLYPFPLLLFLLLFGKTPGNYSMGLSFKKEDGSPLSLTKRSLYSYQSFYIFILFLAVPETIFFLFSKSKTLGETCFSVKILQNHSSKPYPSSKLRIFALLLLFWALPTNFIFWKKVFQNTEFKRTGFHFFQKDQEWLTEKRTRNLKKEIRSPSDFKAFFEELRWSLLWKDMERHMHLLTSSSQLLVGLNLELYKQSLPEDIVFSHVEKTSRKNYFKLFFYRKEKSKKTKTPEFFYLTKKENEWKLDQSPLFLAHYLKL